MNHFQKLVTALKGYSFLLLAVNNALLIGFVWIAHQVFEIDLTHMHLILAAAGLILSILVATLLANFVSEPLRVLWQAILHVSPDFSSQPAPDLEKIKVGREMVTNLVLEVYQLASNANQLKENTTANSDAIQSIVNDFPLPVIAINKDDTIIFANVAAQKYLQLAPGDLINKNFHSVMDMSFSSNDTLEQWLTASKTNTVTASRSWERVRMRLADQKTLRQFDLAAYYNKGNPNGVETVLTLFDHTARYGQDDQSLSFIAIAVHELRTPLTLLRGYVEVLEDELEGKLDAEMNAFLHKLSAAAQQLTAFANNILNVAKVEENQLVLQLNEEKWEDILRDAGNGMALQAQVRSKTIQYQIEPNLPTVAVDRVSIYEVLNNLLDNAIKYSGNSQKILVVARLGKDGMVETIVRDYGVGIPSSVMPGLFEKFYRNFRTQSQVSGSGLGLYLSKAIITAHGGNVWVRSKEGEGTAVGFTLQPYANLAEQQKNSNNKDITRTAHGWIKNHSLYRR